MKILMYKDNEFKPIKIVKKSETEIAYTEALVYTLSADGTYYVVGTGQNSVEQIRTTDASFYGHENGNGLASSFTGDTVSIPAYHNNLPVKGVCHNAFAVTGLKLIYVNGSEMTTIGENAFGFDNNDESSESVLEGLYLPDSITYIGDSLLYGRKGVKEFRIPTAITTPKRYWFLRCGNISVDMSHLTNTGEYTFELSDVTSVVIPPSVTVVGIFNYSSCSHLSEVTIPEGVTSVGMYCFGGSTVTKVVFPNTVTAIDGYMFHNCHSLTYFKMGNAVTSIGSYAFRDCPLLKTLTLPATMTNISRAVFKECPLLTSIQFLGTMTQWNAISKDEAWLDGASLTLVRCVDGDITI